MLFELCDVVTILTAEEVDTSAERMQVLEYRLNRVVSLLERDFPVAVHVIMFHLLHHLPMYINRFGPVNGFWMYPIERFNSWLSSRVLNRCFPEATATEIYRLFDLTYYLHLTKQLPDTSVMEPDDALQAVIQEDNDSDFETAVPIRVNQGQVTLLSPICFELLAAYYKRINLFQNSETQLENKVILLNTYTRLECYGRAVKFSAENKALKLKSFTYKRAP